MANKKRRCCLCKDYFEVEEMVKVPVGWFCSFSHALEYSHRIKLKKRKQAHVKEKKDFRDNDSKKQKELAQVAFNAFIRERDKGNPCISCGRVHAGKINAGHYRSVGAAPHLRFNQFNCHLQCEPCNNNNMLSGNAIEYRINLIKKIGIEKVEWIEARNEPLNFRVEDYRNIKTYFRAITRALQKERKK